MTVTIIWRDRDHTTTQHDFESPKDPDLQEWLCDVLHDIPDQPDYEDYIEDEEDCGTLRLAFYEAHDCDHHGSFDVTVDGWERSAAFLHLQAT